MTPALDTDILRRIILYSNHSIRELRKVSHSFKDLVEDEYSKFCNMPTLSEMLITAPEDAPGSVVTINLKIHIHLGFVLRKLTERNMGFALVESDKENLVTVQKTVQLEELINNPEHVLSSARQFKRIRRVVIKDIKGGMKQLLEYFTNIRCSELLVDENYLTPEIGEETIKLVRAWEPTLVSIDIAEHTLLRHGDFLVELSELVDGIHIVQRNYFDALNPKYLFDFSIRDCYLDILSKMFAKRVSTIKVEHDNRNIVVGRFRLQRFIDEAVTLYPGKNVSLEMNAFYSPFIPSPFPFKVVANDISLKVRGANSTNKNCHISMMRHTIPLD